MSAALAVEPIQVRKLEEFKEKLKPEFQKIKNAVDAAKIKSKTIKGYTELNIKGYTELESLYNNLVEAISKEMESISKARVRYEESISM